MPDPLAEFDCRLRDVESKVTTHEAVCAERYQQIVDGAKNMRDELASTNQLIRVVALMLLAGMAGVLISLVFK
jgi:hypothetical protein